MTCASGRHIDTHDTGNWNPLNFIFFHELCFVSLFFFISNWTERGQVVHSNEKTSRNTNIVFLFLFLFVFFSLYFFPADFADVTMKRNCVVCNTFKRTHVRQRVTHTYTHTHTHIYLWEIVGAFAHARAGVCVGYRRDTERNTGPKLKAVLLIFKIWRRHAPQNTDGTAHCWSISERLKLSKNDKWQKSMFFCFLLLFFHHCSRNRF